MRDFSYQLHLYSGYIDMSDFAAAVERALHGLHCIQGATGRCHAIQFLSYAHMIFVAPGIGYSCFYCGHGPQNVSRLFIRSILQPSLSAIALAIGPSGCMHTYYLRSPNSTPASPPHHVWNHVGLRLQYLDTPSPAPVTCTFDECRLPSIDASLAVFDRQISHQ